MRPLALIVFALTLAGCCAPEARFLRPRAQAAWQTPQRAGDWWVRAQGGGTLHGWIFRPMDAPPDAPLPAVLLLHGRADTIADYREAAPAFADRLGVAVALVDYRGWGRSSEVACPSRRHLLADARAALAHLQERDDVDARAMALWGVSLGGLPATALFADEPGVRALVLWAPPADSQMLIDDYRGRMGLVRWATARLTIGRWREPRREIARAGDRPVLIVHGEQDRIVPIRHGAAVYESALGAGVPAELFMEGGGHAGPSEAGIERIVGFLQEHLVQGGP